MASDPTTLWTVVHQRPLSMGVFWQENWSGLLFSPPLDLPNPGIKSISPPLQAVSYLLSHWGSHKGTCNSGYAKLLAFPECAIPLYFPMSWTYYPSCLKFLFFFFLLCLLNQILLTLKDITPKLIIMSSIFCLIHIKVSSVISNTYPYNNISHAVLK